MLPETPSSMLLRIGDFQLAATALLCATLLVGLIDRQPARRLAIAWALAGVVPLLAALAATPGWSSLHLGQSSRAAPNPAAESPAPAWSAPNGFDRRLLLASPSADVSAPSEDSRAVLIAPDPSTTFPELLAGAATWSLPLGSLLAAVWLAWGGIAAARLVRGADEPNEALRAEMAALSAPDSPPRLRVSRRLATAVAIGLRRPTILIPDGLADLESGRDRQSILAHELAHIRRGDLWLLAAMRLLLVLLWPNPLYWLLRRRVRLDQETLADAAAAELTSRQAYAERLVDWARRFSTPPRLAGAAGLWEGASQLRSRVRLLLDERFTVVRSASRRSRVVAGFGCVAVALVASLVTLAPAEPPVDERADQAVEEAETDSPTAEGPTLRGRITDQTGEPLPGVKVVLYGGVATRFRGLDATTDANGAYAFEPLQTGALVWGENEKAYRYTGVQFEHVTHVPADGESWRDIRVPTDADEHVLDLVMNRGGFVDGVVTDRDSGEPIANLGLRVHNGGVDSRDSGSFLVYATTDGRGRFKTRPLASGEYVVDINDGDYRGDQRYPKIGKAIVAAGETVSLQLVDKPLPELLDPFRIIGTAFGDDGKKMTYGGVGVRLKDGGKLRSRGGGIDGRPVFGLGFGPVERLKVSDSAPYGVGTHDVELFGNNARFGYTLASRQPAEPLRITDNPDRSQDEAGYVYIRPSEPVEFVLTYVKDDRPNKPEESVDWVDGLAADEEGETPRDERDPDTQPLSDASEEIETQEVALVIAQHVLLLNGQTVLNWPEFEARVREMRSQGPVRPHFYVTRGARDKGRDNEYQPIVSKLLPDVFGGYSVGSLWPRTDLRYDRIRKPSDTEPVEADRQPVEVVDAVGKPVAGAQVITITPIDESISYQSYHATLINGSVRNPIEHVLSTTDAQGRTAIYPPSDTPYSLLVTHPESGFLYVRAVDIDRAKPLTLMRWAAVDVGLEPGNTESQGFSISTRIEPNGELPEVVLNQNWQEQGRPLSEGRYRWDRVPPFYPTSIAQAFKGEQGSSFHMHSAIVSPMPGDTSRLSLGPLSKSQRAQLESMRERNAEASRALN